MANRLALELVADANPLLKGMQQAQQSLDKFTDAAASAGRSIGGSLGTAIDNFMNLSKGGGAAAGVLAGGFAAAAAGAVALTAAAGRQIEALDMLAQKTGISLTSLQNWSVIMAENDFQAESLATAMSTLSKQIVDARDPASKAAASFQEMGLAATDLGSTESVIRAVADRFATMADGPDKARIAVDLFGKSGLDLIPILNRGSQALDESTAASEKFAAVLRSNQVEALKAADDAMDRVGVAANALKSQLGAVFAPAVEWAARMLADAIGVLARWARDLDTALDTLAIRITHLGLAAKELGAVLFSKDVINGDAWKQALNNITLIDQEAAKLIAKRRELADVGDAMTGGTHIQMAATVAKNIPAKSANIAAPPQWMEQQNAQVVEYLANRRAEEALGHVLVQIAQREYREVSKKIEVQQQIEHNLVEISEQEELGWQIVVRANDAWKHRNDVIEMAAERAKVLDEAQQTMFAMERGAFGASDAARQVRMNLIEAEGALQRRVIEETIANEQKKAAAIENLEIQMDTKRMQTIQQYPTFFEQQMQSVVQSNSFAIGQITTTWTSGLANAAVNGGDFVQQAWKSTQVAVLQGLLNFGIQKVALLALQASQELGLVTATAASVAGINAAKNSTIVAGDAAAATATTSIWAGAAAGITGTFAAITGAITGFFTATLIPFFVTIGEALMTFLSSIAAAASSTIFGIPYGVAILAGVAIIAAAIGTLAAFAFKDGGIVTGPTMGMIGEGGSNEAVIPLNKRGVAFMRDAIGGSNGAGPVTVILELDGRQIGRSMYDTLPSIMRVRGIAA